MEEKTVSSKVVYSGKKLRLKVKKVSGHFGFAEREIIGTHQQLLFYLLMRQIPFI